MDTRTSVNFEISLQDTAQHRLQRTGGGFALARGDSAPKADSFFGLFPPTPRPPLKPAVSLPLALIIGEPNGSLTSSYFKLVCG
jgi:hypothetical protein